MIENPLNSFIAGFVGGTFGSLIGHPFDTIKVRLQTQKYNNLKNCILKTYQKENIKGFYKGYLLLFILLAWSSHDKKPW